MIPFQSSSLLNGSVGTDSDAARRHDTPGWESLGRQQIDQLRPIERGPREENFRKGETNNGWGNTSAFIRAAPPWHTARCDFSRAAGDRPGGRRMRLQYHTGHERRGDAAGPVDRQPWLPRQSDPCPGAHRGLEGVLRGFDAEGYDCQDDNLQRGTG